MAETATPRPDPITLPVDLDQLEDVLTAYAEEGQETPQILLPTLADAQRAARRLAEIQREAQDLAEIYDAEEQRLQQEIEALHQRKTEALRTYERRQSWYLMALEQFTREQYRLNPKIKTYSLPAGDLCLRKQQPEWHYGEDLLERLRQIGATDYIRVREEPDKMALKRAAQVIDGRAALVDAETGEVHELPIEVVERPPKFEFKPADR